jgi:hypothetical protein
MGFPVLVDCGNFSGMSLKVATETWPPTTYIASIKHTIRIMLKSCNRHSFSIGA